ncbi:MAG: mevalonate kinase [Deltaproteobacteria bacterium]|nr:mevalonate kinase [Deltaproteobacteria bacterium]
MGIGYGFGKIILIGDQFINYGVPAIVSAIDLKTKAIVKRVKNGTLKVYDNRKETPGYKEKKLHQQKESIDRILNAMKIDIKKNPIEIIFEGNLIAASGLGASAASCVALTRALSDEFKMNLSDEEINNIAFEGEKAYHGIPSGVDNTASTFGGILFFMKDLSTNKNIVEKIKLKKKIEFVVSDSQVVADTAYVGKYIKGLKEKQPERFSEALKKINDQVFELRRNLEIFNLKRVGELMNEYHKIAIEFGLSHEKIIYLTELAIKNGAYGAKLTGGGMGGNMIALTPGSKLQDKVAMVLEKEGYHTLKVTI